MAHHITASHKTKQEREVSLDFPLPLKLIPATTYSDKQTSRLAQIRKTLIWLPGHPTDTLRSTTRDGVLYCRVRHETGQTSLIPRYLTASHKTKQEREVSLDFPLSLKLIPAPIYSPTDTLRSTIGDGVLNCRVRHGTGWIHSSITTRNFMNKRFHVYLLCQFSQLTN